MATLDRETEHFNWDNAFIAGQGIGTAVGIGYVSRLLFGWIDTLCYQAYDRIVFSKWHEIPVNPKQAPDLAFQIGLLSDAAIRHRLLKTNRLVQHKFYTTTSLGPATKPTTIFRKLYLPKKNQYYKITHPCLGGTVYIRPVFTPSLNLHLISLCFKRSNTVLPVTHLHQTLSEIDFSHQFQVGEKTGGSSTSDTEMTPLLKKQKHLE